MSLRRIAAGVAAASLLFLAGCYSTPVMPPSGFIYQNTDSLIGPPMGDFGSRRGESCATSILGMFAFGDASAKAASNAGGINQLKHLDYSTHGFVSTAPLKKVTGMATGFDTWFQPGGNQAPAVATTNQVLAWLDEPRVEIVIERPRMDPELSIKSVTTVSRNFISFSCL